MSSRQVQVTVTLPDAVARDAEACGLLEDVTIERLLRDELARRRVDKLFQTADRLTATAATRLTPDEIAAEIQAARDARHAQTGGA